MTREALTPKILILGVDGMDPRLTRTFVDEGKMPSTAEFIKRGASRQDLRMLGALPTITPPMWTTMATGAYPMTHGITCFYRQSPESLDTKEYNLTSRNCRAEQLWNVFAEAGKKTLVWHWPGSSWPPSSDSPYLHVVDGTTPGAVNMGSGQVEGELVLVASPAVEGAHFRPKAASDANVPCVLTDLKTEDPLLGGKDLADALNNPFGPKLILKPEDGENAISDKPFDVVLTQIKPPKNWGFALPEGAKEFTVLLSGGFISRPALILSNEQGVYHLVKLYKDKKTAEPLAVLPHDVFVRDVIDEGVKNEQKYVCNRNMRVIELHADGDYVKLWISAAMDTADDKVFWPKSLYQEVTAHCGYPQPTSMLGGADYTLISKCMGANWEASCDWQARSLNYLLANGGYDVIFSHLHNIDLQSHMIVKFMKDKGRSKLSETEYAKLLEAVYMQTDRYLGKFLHCLDEGWTIFILSDHAAVCPVHTPHALGECIGVNVRVLQKLGYTALKKNDQGEELYEIDWSKTRAVANRGNHIYLNIKGRDAHGIIDPKDQYEVEEQLMTDLYGYRDEETGQRVIALALRNKDAALLGLSGPECGDIIYFVAEGYNIDHGDCLSTTEGYAGTSVSPLFIAAGAGIKPGFVTTRQIRQVDVAPTAAVLGGVRMPRQCEGAPVYQILTEEY